MYDLEKVKFLMHVLSDQKGGSARTDMLETFIEFTFDAAHTTPPHSFPHGHTFKAQVVLKGVPDPHYGWSHDFRDVEPVVESVRLELDHKYLNDIAGLKMPTLENVTRWIWHRLDGRIEGLDRVVLRRGAEGHAEGCSYRGTGATGLPAGMV